MGKELIISGPFKIDFREYKEQKPGEGEIKLKTLFSGISHGTEMAHYRGTSPSLHKARIRGIYKEGEPGEKYPLTCGYEQVSEVVELGKDVTILKVGDKVQAEYCHRETGIVMAEDVFKLPKNLDPVKGVFLPLGGVAYDAILSSRIRIGESAVIFGQGLIGLFIVQLCKLAGIEPIVAVDILEDRLAMAKKMGADYVFNPAKCDVADEVRNLTDDKGADVTFETSGSYKALHEAIRTCAHGYSRVVAVAFYQGEAKGLYLGEEFHSYRGTEIITTSQRFNQTMGNQWNTKRISKTLLKMIVDNKIKVDGLITHRFEFNEAEKAFQLIDKHPEKCIKVILEF